MLEIINDSMRDDDFIKDLLQNHKYDILLVTSDNEQKVKKKIKEILLTFNYNKITFIAMDFLQTIEEIKTSINKKILKFEENDGKKFYMKKFPKIFIEILSEDDIVKVLKFWPNSIIEQHCFTIASESNDIDLIIASPLECEKFGFNLIYKPKYKDKISEILKA